MKKVLSLLAVIALVATSLTGCAPKVYKLGSGSYTSVTGRAAVTEKEGRVQVTTVVATVLLDSDGKFVYVDIDSAQNQGTFDTLGAILVADPAKTKTEKGAEYGMGASSTIGKEWFEQMAALETYMIGKTLEEVLATPTAEKDASHPAVPTGEDLMTSVTISIEGYLAAVEKAVANAVEVENVASVGSASVSTVAGRAATAEKEGRIQTNVMFVGAAFDKDGKVIAASLDTAQNQGTFDTLGAILVADSAKTKNEKGAEYGMAASSTIGKDWFEQAQGLTNYWKGKTADEIAAMELDADNKSTNADVLTTTTVSIDTYMATLAKAYANAVVIE